MWDPYSVIKTILVTEKSMDLKAINKYLFQVNPSATKIDVARAVEQIHGVKVKSVNVLNRMGKPKRLGRRSSKMGRTSASRRAVVTLSEGNIDVL